jgi:DNA-binding beta-propeller fold protein YncE
MLKGMTMVFRSGLVLQFCLACCVLAGCESSPSPPETASGDGLFVLNEGAFGQNSAEITYYSFTDGTVWDNMYSRVNPGKILGDVANSIALGGGEAFIVINNSNKVEIVDVETLASTGTIFLDTSPRQMVVVSPDKGYVSNMDSTVSVIDIFLRRSGRKITVGPYPEGLFVSGGKLYVAVGGFGSGRTVQVIDIASDVLVATIPVPDGPTYFAARSDGAVLLSCIGYTDYVNPVNDTDGALVVIDPAIDAVVDSLIIPGHPGKLVIGPDDFAYLIGPGSFTGGPIWKIDARDLSVVSETFIVGTFYGVGVDPVTFDVFAGDAKGFAVNGTVQIHDRDGAKLTEFVAGIGPSWFLLSRY